MTNKKTPKIKAKLVPSKRYEIGDDSTQNAGPRHHVTITNPYWIDIHPVTIGDLQVCILNGCFKPKRRLNGEPGSKKQEPITVDGFFTYVLQTTNKVFNTRPNSSLFSSFPACGLLLDEAQQICNYYGARLPNEIEWEIALSWNDSKSPSPGIHAPFVSKLGCECYAGVIQEWTTSPWTNRYWMGNSKHLSDACPENPLVTTRGCLPTAKVPSQFARIPAHAEDCSVPRVFRRVWDQKK